MPWEMTRVEMPHQEALNACGIHVIEALTSAGQGEEIDADQDVSYLWANDKRDTYLRELILAAVETRRPDVQRRFELELEALNSLEYAGDRKAKRRKLFGERGIVR